MFFKDRTEAGQLLARALKHYKNQHVVVYALPRGGVVTALEIAKYLHAPLDLIIARKIGHPFEPEYAIAATAETGHVLRNQAAVESIEDEEWLKGAVEQQRMEAKRRREKYLQNKPAVPVAGKIAILVDDGVATGLTMRVGIKELQHRHPKKIIVATPVVPQKIANILQQEADELVTLETPPSDEFLGSIGAYYDKFPPIIDNEVIAILTRYQPNQTLKKAISAKDLAIDIASQKEEELFKWLLACLLFGKPIQQKVAKQTYFEFIKEGLTTPEKILSAGWDKLVSVLDKGHYVRYDFSTATKLLTVSKQLKEQYGSMTKLLKESKTKRELEKHLQEFKGIGPVTTKIFLKELQIIL